MIGKEKNPPPKLVENSVFIFIGFTRFQIIELEHVVSCKNPRFWQHSGEILVSAVVVQCQSDVSEQKMIHNVS